VGGGIAANVMSNLGLERQAANHVLVSTYQSELVGGRQGCNNI
jgi:hypothetical protein